MRHETPSGVVTIRDFETIEEYRACVALQEETWGAGFSERVSAAILKVSRILGGVAAGAWTEDGTLAGFVFGMTGPRKGRLVHWSDMLAVRPEYRDAGLGRALKAYQRKVLLDAGIEVMHWTFDPLQSRNAHLNLSHLGIVVQEYVQDMYGETDSPLHRGIGTDRFIALWHMDSPRVRERVEAGNAGPPPGAGTGAPRALGADANREEADDRAVPLPGPVRLDLDAPEVRVAIPADIGAVMAASMDAARLWRERTRAAFTAYLGRGYEVRELLRGSDTSEYLLVRPDLSRERDEA